MTTRATIASDEIKENVNVNDTVESLLHVGSPPKRLLDEMRGDDSLETPPRHKKWRQQVGGEECEGGAVSWEQWEPFAPAKGRNEGF